MAHRRFDASGLWKGVGALLLLLACGIGAGWCALESSPSETLDMGVNSMISSKHPNEPLDYYKVDFCRHRGKDQDQKAATLGNMILGDIYKHTPYQLEVGVDQTEETVCTTKCSEACVLNFVRYVKEGYKVRFVVKDVVGLSETPKGYTVGHPIGDPMDETHVHVNNHVVFEVFYFKGEAPDASTGFFSLSTIPFYDTLNDMIRGDDSTLLIGEEASSSPTSLGSDGALGDEKDKEGGGVEGVEEERMTIVGFETKSPSSVVLSLDNIRNNKSRYEVIEWKISVRWIEINSTFFGIDFARYLAEHNRSYLKMEKFTQGSIQWATVTASLAVLITVFIKLMANNHVRKSSTAGKDDASDRGGLLVPCSNSVTDIVFEVQPASNVPPKKWREVEGSRSKRWMPVFNQSEEEESEEDLNGELDYDYDEEDEDLEGSNGGTTKAVNRYECEGGEVGVLSMNKLTVSWNKIIDSSKGWKAYSEYVFRRPRHLFSFFCAFVGTGVQINLVMLLVSIVSMIAMPDQSIFIELVLISYVMSSLVAGYTACRIHTIAEKRASMQKMEIFKKVLLTGMLFTTVVFGFMTLANVCFYRTGTSTLIEWNYFPPIYVLANVGTVMISLFGYLVGLRFLPVQLSVKTNQDGEGQVNTGRGPWGNLGWWFASFLMRTLVSMLCVMPAAPIFRMFYVVPIDIILQDSTMLVSLAFGLVNMLVIWYVVPVYNYFRLCGGDYHWWWPSFGVPAQGALWLMGYTVFYYLYESEISGTFSAVIHFTYASIFCVGCALAMGSVGFIATFRYFNVTLFPLAKYQ